MPEATGGRAAHEDSDSLSLDVSSEPNPNLYVASGNALRAWHRLSVLSAMAL